MAVHADVELQNLISYILPNIICLCSIVRLYCVARVDYLAEFPFSCTFLTTCHWSKTGCYVHFYASDPQIHGCCPEFASVNNTRQTFLSVQINCWYCGLKISNILLTWTSCTGVFTQSVC